MTNNQRIHAFIDSQNLTLGVKSCGWNLDYYKFRVYLRDKYKVDKAFLFLGYMPAYKSLYESLEQAGYELVFRPVVSVRKRGKIIVKGNVDAELILHCAKGLYTNAFDKAVIISADGDFQCLIDELVASNKLQRLLIPNQKKYSSLLQKYEGQIDFVSQLRRKLELNKMRGVG